MDIKKNNYQFSFIVAHYLRVSKDFKLPLILIILAPT